MCLTAQALLRLERRQQIDLFTLPNYDPQNQRAAAQVIAQVTMRPVVLPMGTTP